MGRVIFTAMLCLIFVQCDRSSMDWPVDGAVYSKNFVDVYLEAESIYCDMQKSCLDEDERFTIYLSFRGDLIRPSDNSKFQELAERYNDESFNQRNVPGRLALSEPITAINVVCDKQYDSVHDAGESLNDIICLYCQSPYEYIQNNYMVPRDYAWKTDEDNVVSCFGYLGVKIPLNEVNETNTALIEPNSCLLGFSHRRDISSECSFTVTVKISGKTYIYTTEFK